MSLIGLLRPLMPSEWQVSLLPGLLLSDKQYPGHVLTSKSTVGTGMVMSKSCDLLDFIIHISLSGIEWHWLTIALDYVFAGLFHPARRVRQPYWRLYNSAYVQVSVSDFLHVFHLRLHVSRKTRLRSIAAFSDQSHFHDSISPTPITVSKERC